MCIHTCVTPSTEVGGNRLLRLVHGSEHLVLFSPAPFFVSLLQLFQAMATDVKDAFGPHIVVSTGVSECCF